MWTTSGGAILCERKKNPACWRCMGSDMMLNRDSVRYDYEMHLCRNANINLVRIWGGGVTPCDEFSKLPTGMTFSMSDFWVTGDTQGEFKDLPTGL